MEAGLLDRVIPVIAQPGRHVPKATVHKAAKQDKARVAIVGGGPAGMAAALELANLGYRPTVFETFPIGAILTATFDL